VTLNLAETSVVKSQLSVQYMANLFCVLILRYMLVFVVFALVMSYCVIVVSPFCSL